MKNKTAKITMTKRTAGLILVLDEGLDSLWKVPLKGGGGGAGGGYVKNPSFWLISCKIQAIFKWVCLENLKETMTILPKHQIQQIYDE